MSFCLFVRLMGFGFFKIRFLCIRTMAVLDLLCRLGYSRTHRDLPASASQVLGLKHGDAQLKCNALIFEETVLQQC